MSREIIIKAGSAEQIQRQTAKVRQAQLTAYAIAQTLQRELQDLFESEARGIRQYPVVRPPFVRGGFVVVELDPLSVGSKAQRRRILDPMLLARYSQAVHRPVWGLTRFPRHNATAEEGAWLVTSWLDPKEAARRMPAATPVAQVAAPVFMSGTLDLDDQVLQSQHELAVPVGRASEVGPLGASLGDETDLLVLLRRMIHVMAMGETGSGKTNWIKAALIALTKQATPDEIRFAFISPKESEFADLARSAYAWTSAQWDGRIAVEAEDADRLVGELRREFRRRDSTLFVQAGVTSIDEYNQVVPTHRLPRIILVVDEIVDLVSNMSSGSKFKERLSGLTSIGRSGGIHVFAGTTNMNYQVLPTTWSKNVPNTIMFRVHDKATADHFQCYGAQAIGDGDEQRGIFVARINGRLWHGKAYRAEMNTLGTSIGRAERVENMTKTESHIIENSLPITARIAELVVYAVEHLDGRFVTNALFEAFRARGWKSHEVKALALQLAECNEHWLELETGRGRTGSRIVTQALKDEAQKVLKQEMVRQMLEPVEAAQ